MRSNLESLGNILAISTYFIGLQNHDSQSAIELLLTQPMLMDSLRKAHMGNYGVILSLLGCLDHGMSTKQLVDKVIDACRISIPPNSTPRIALMSYF